MLCDFIRAYPHIVPPSVWVGSFAVWKECNGHANEIFALVEAKSIPWSRLRQCGTGECHGFGSRATRARANDPLMRGRETPRDNAGSD